MENMSRKARGRRFVWAALLMLAGPLPPPASGQEPAPAAASVRPEALEFAHRLFRGRRYNEAAEEYEAFLKSNPSREFEIEARFGLANARHFLQEYQAARQQFEQFLVVAGPAHANAPTAGFRVGEMAYVLGDLPAARDRLAAYLNDHPGGKHEELALPYLGDVLYRSNDLPGAEAAYRKALSTYPDGRLADRARLYLGLTLSARGQPAEAEKILAALAARPAATGKDEALFQLAQIQAADGRLAEAVSSLETLEKEAPQSRLLSRARLARAEALTALGKSDEAAALLQSLADDPSPDLAARAFYARGVDDLRRDRPADALKVFDEGLARHPESTSAPALLYRSAEALARLGKAEEARDRYLRMTDTYPADSWADEAAAQAASLSLEIDQPEQAAEIARKLETTEGADAPLVALARVLQGRAALKAGKPAEAIDLLRKTLEAGELDPATGQSARYYLGQALREAGQADEADRLFAELADGPPSAISAEARYLVGQAHFEAGRFDEAAKALAAYLDALPSGGTADHALARLAMAREELGQADEASRALDDLESKYPDSPLTPMARVRMGEKALATGAAARAVELLAPIASREGDPLRPRALSSLGFAKLKADDPAGAADAFDTLVSTYPDDPLAKAATLARARALEAAGKVDDALMAFQEAGSGPALLARARLLAESGRPADAADAFASYIENHLAAEGAEAPDLVLSEYAWALLDSGKTAESDALFRRVVEEHPESPRAADARLNLAESAFQAGEFARVREWLEPMVSAPEGAGPAIDPKLLQSALYRLGRAQAGLKDWNAASETFGRLVSDFPDGPFLREARFWAAEVAYLRGDAEKAEAAFASLAADAGEADAEWQRTARLRRVQCLAQLKRWDEALTEADALLSSAPDFPQGPEVQVARAQALIAQARFDDARAALQAAIEARKGTELAAQAQFLRGETFFHQEDHREALREFLKAATLYESPRWQALALFEAGQVYEKLDRWPDAVRAYEELRSSFPSEPPSSQAEPRLAAAKARAGEAPNRRE